MQSFVRPLLLLAAVLLVPILPFLLLHGRIDQWYSHWQAASPSRPVVAIVIIGLLSMDIFLPVPSSLVSTLGGKELGALGGAAASWLGMSIGAMLGFAVARRWGRPIALWLVGDKDLERIEQASQLWGTWALVLTRAVPVLAEACVLLLGTQRMSWRQFLPPVLLANLGIAVAYSALGELASRQGWLPSALAVSLALPILITALLRRRWGAAP